jgi:hypothetical protein
LTFDTVLEDLVTRLALLLSEFIKDSIFIILRLVRETSGLTLEELESFLAFAVSLCVSLGIRSFRAGNWQAECRDGVEAISRLANTLLVSISDSILVGTLGDNTLSLPLWHNESILALANTKRISDSVCILALNVDTLGVSRVFFGSSLANTISLIVSHEVFSGALLFDTDIIDGSWVHLESRLAFTQTVFISYSISIRAGILLTMSLNFEGLANTVSFFVSVEVRLWAGGWDTSLLSPVSLGSSNTLTLTSLEVSKSILLLTFNGCASSAGSEFLVSGNTLANSLFILHGISLFASTLLAGLRSSIDSESLLADTFTIIISHGVLICADCVYTNRASKVNLESLLALTHTSLLVSHGISIRASFLNALLGGSVLLESNWANTLTILISDHVWILTKN